MKRDNMYRYPMIMLPSQWKNSPVAISDQSTTEWTHIQTYKSISFSCYLTTEEFGYYIDELMRNLQRLEMFERINFESAIEYNNENKTISDDMIIINNIHEYPTVVYIHNRELYPTGLKPGMFLFEYIDAQGLKNARGQSIEDFYEADRLFFKAYIDGYTLIHRRV